MNHKDENKLNNRADNLEWCDRAYNNSYGTGRKRAGQKCSRGVIGMSDTMENTLSFSSVREMLNSFGMKGNAGFRKSIKTGKPWMGYVWKYS